MGSGSLPATSGGVTGPRYDPTAEYRRGMIALRADRYRDAVDAFTHVVEARPGDAEAWRMLGEAKSGAGGVGGAAHAFARAVALDPAAIDSRRDLALALVKLKQKDRAAVQLDALKARAAACNDACPEAALLEATITAIEAALAG
jgi:predicted Zn-dependent protease